MEMGIELLIPCMQRGNKARFPAERVLTELQKRPGHGLEQDREHHLFVLQDDGVELMGEGKDHMEVVYGQNLVSSFFEPTFPGHVLACRAMSIAA